MLTYNYNYKYSINITTYISLVIIGTMYSFTGSSCTLTLLGDEFKYVEMNFNDEKAEVSVCRIHSFGSCLGGGDLR